MKIAVVGGGGVRAPLLLKGIAREHSALPASEISLFDLAADKLALLEPVCRALVERAGNPFRVARASALEEALEGATFIITSIRAGGMAARRADERYLLDRGLLGQETVGAAGFAKALRTIPPMVEIARAAARRAPSAWIINFTNPVGIITAAVRKATRARIIGICDTPLALFEGIARALGAPLASLHFDYFGLNHLGWVKAVLKEGTDCLPELFEDDARLESVYSHKLFDAQLLRSLGVLPSEYLYYYYCASAALANLRQAGETRAEAIEKMNARLWEELARAVPLSGIEIYERYLGERNATYMTAEAAAPREALYSEAAGYDRIALAVMMAIHGDTRAVIPVDVENRGAIEALEDDDVVEVPSVIGRNGALPLACGRPPASVSKLLEQVRDYERLTLEAALKGSAALAARALAANPLISDPALAAELFTAFRARHRELLGYLKD